MKLSLCRPKYYRVKKGQTLSAVAKAFGLPPRILAVENALSEELFEGQILFIPACEGNLYTVRGGESKTLLCGSAENFGRKNRTDCFYIGQVILI